jgi:Uma2 family endonuclease
MVHLKHAKGDYPERITRRKRPVPARQHLTNRTSSLKEVKSALKPARGAVMNVAFVRDRTRISIDRYQKMVATGVLTKSDRIELIDGEMVNMAPIGPKHAAITARLTKQFILGVGDDAIISPGGPVNLGDFSEPQPDVMLLRPRDDFYAGKIPEATDVLLIIEVSDSTLAFDQSTKRALYARHGVVEYWIVDVEGKRIQVHREPTANGYGLTLEFSTTERVSPQALPAVQLTVQTLFL